MFVLALSLIWGGLQIHAQDRLKLMPGFEHYSTMQAQLQGAFVSGAVQNVAWAADGRSFVYAAVGKRYRFHVATRQAVEEVAPAAATPAGGGRGGRRGGAPPAVRGGLEQEQNEMPVMPMTGCPEGGPARGRQEECVLSPNGKLKAFYRARNFWVANADGSGEVQVTADGRVAGRIKNGSGS